MPEPNEPFDMSFYVLCVVGHWILVGDALATPEGRERVKNAFRSAMLGAGTFEDLEAIPEFQKAMIDVEHASVVTIPAPPPGFTLDDVTEGKV